MWTPSQASQATRPGEPQGAPVPPPRAGGRSSRASPCRGSGTAARLPAERAEDVAGRVVAHLDRGGRDAGHATVRPAPAHARSPTTNTSPWPGTVRSGRDRHATGPVERHPERARERRARDPGRPHHGAGGDPLAADLHPGLVERR